MAESTPLVPEEYRQLNRSLTQKVLDKAASDPQWKEQLLDDPEAAMRAANFPETQQLEQMEGGAGEPETRGHYRHPGDPICCTWQCVWWTQYWERRTN
jgi:hypothetical protein